jgi:hypothetical protein
MQPRYREKFLPETESQPFWIRSLKYDFFGYFSLGKFFWNCNSHTLFIHILRKESLFFVHDVDQ